MSQYAKTSPQGFTIIELLVVISIVAILLALLCPVMKSVRTMAQQAQCAANLRMVSGAMNGFFNDHDGALPTTIAVGAQADNWVFWQPGRNMDQSGLAPYLAARGDNLKKVFVCPAQSLDNQTGFAGGGAYPLTYSMNCADESYYVPVLFRKIKNPWEKILVYDENQNADDDQFFYGTDRDTLAGRHGGVDTQGANLNGTGERSYERGFGNVLWCDGHVSLADNNMCHTALYNEYYYAGQ